MDGVFHFVHTGKTIESVDPRENGEFQMFSTLPGIIKRQIVESFTPVSLVSLMRADPSLYELARSVMKKKQLRMLFLDILPPEHAVMVVLNWNGDVDCVQFNNETRDHAGELEMYRRAYSFILYICDRTDTSKAQICIDAESEIIPNDLHRLRLPSIGRLLSLEFVVVPVGAPFEFLKQFKEVQEAAFFVPFRPDLDVQTQLARLENLYKSSPLI